MLCLDTSAPVADDNYTASALSGDEYGDIDESDMLALGQLANEDASDVAASVILQKPPIITGHLTSTLVPRSL